MPHAQIAVAQDRSAEVSIDGAVTPHPDLGSAMAHLAGHARSAQVSLQVTIADGGIAREIRISENGQIAALPAGESGEDAVPPDGEAAAPVPDGSAGAEPVEGAVAAASDPEAGASADAGAPTDLAVPASDDEGPAYPLYAQAPAGLDADSQRPASGSADDEIARSTEVQAGEGAERQDRETASEAEFPVGTRYSGPAETIPGSGATDPQERGAKRRRGTDAARSRRRPAVHAPRGMRLTVPGLVLAVLLVLAMAFFFLPDLIGTPAAKESEVPTSSTVPSRVPVTQEKSTTPVPGYAEEPEWEAEVPQTASVTASSRGILVVDGGDLSVLDPTTGEVRYSNEYSGTVSFAADTVIEGRAALVWRYENRVEALFDGEDSTVAYDLSPTARMSSAGDSVLIREGNDLSTLAADGSFVDIPTPPPGSTPMAVDGGRLVSAPFDGPLELTDIASGEMERLDLESPGDGLEIKQWKSAGHGLAITVWGEPEANPTSGQRLQLAVHSLQDGSLSSVNEVSSGELGEADWTRGQDYKLAVIGPYLYDLRSGLLVMDGTESGVQLGEPRGDLVPGSQAGAGVILADTVSGGPTAYTTGADLLAVVDDARYAIVRSGADRVVAYPQD
ncbi:hypothetical protein [Brevibacterium sp.]|uniref:hypothetical protein n=1 Tax=Brevibacterium sp. TaxID=1701 RepID=UPI0025C67B1B|nr:hypothetical protein [Brevibacterium sp.]